MNNELIRRIARGMKIRHALDLARRGEDAGILLRCCLMTGESMQVGELTRLALLTTPEQGQR